MDRKRPGGLMAIAIVGIILGGLGSCGGLSSIASLAMQDQMQALTQQMAEVSSAGNSHLYEQQMILQERINELSEVWKPALFASQIGNLLASLALLAGAILLFKWSSNGPAIFSIAAAFSILADGAIGVIQIFYQLEIGTAMQEYMASLTSDPALAGAEQSMSAIGEASTKAGMLFGVAWVAVKLAFYVYGIVYLRKPEVRALFSSASST